MKGRIRLLFGSGLVMAMVSAVLFSGTQSASPSPIKNNILRHQLNMELGNVKPGQGNHRIHGYLTNAPEWQVTELKSDGKASWVTSRLEFYKQPQYMAQLLEEIKLEVSASGIEIVQETPAPPIEIRFDPRSDPGDSEGRRAHCDERIVAVEVFGRKSEELAKDVAEICLDRLDLSGFGLPCQLQYGGDRIRMIRRAVVVAARGRTGQSSACGRHRGAAEARGRRAGSPESTAVPQQDAQPCVAAASERRP